jgi:hypothetical protein
MKKDKEQHFKDLYDAALEVITDLLAEINVFDSPEPSKDRKIEAKQLIKRYMTPGLVKQ